MIKRTSGSPDKLILIKSSACLTEYLKQYYGDNFVAYGLPEKSNATERKEIITDLKELEGEFKLVLVADTDMFKTLAHVTKVTSLDGYPKETELGTAFIVPNYQAIFYNPAQGERLNLIMSQVDKYLLGKYSDLGQTVIEESHYCYDLASTRRFLGMCLKKPLLAIDIETAPIVGVNCKDPALHHYSSYITSIGLAWDKHSGGAIKVNGNEDMYALLKIFFNEYKGKTIYHNSSFDITHLIYHCYMTHLEDYENLLVGLHTLCKDFEDTKHIAYLCLNSCADYSLGLKALSHEYTGDYAEEEIGDTTKIKDDELLKYNLTDVCATHYVYEKFLPRLKEEEQEDIYRKLFLPTQKVLIETQLVGARLKPEKVYKLNKELNSKYLNIISNLRKSPKVEHLMEKVRAEAFAEYLNGIKDKSKTIEDFFNLKASEDYKEFNPQSSSQLARLLFEEMKLPIVEKTKGGAPATSASVLDTLANIVTTDEDKNIINNLIELSKVKVILSNFMSTFTTSPTVDGLIAIYGSFNLGGTVTGRLSSSKPNLQQMPSTGSAYAKPIKELFIAPKGYVFCGADFASLEDRISALTTKDTNKLKVYTSSYDGHCLRAYSYFGDKMPDIQEKMSWLDKPGKFYKVIMEDGSVEYFHEDSEEFKKLKGE